MRPAPPVLPALSVRLRALAEAAGDGIACLGDVGTDHGLLPLAMLEAGRAERAVASDVREGPLRAAQRNLARRPQLQARMQLRLCSGLRAYGVGECDQIVIAGMGGLLIRDILREAAEAGRIAPGQRFVLQPNTQEPGLRAYLYGGGFHTDSEWACRENGHVYLILCCTYDGVRRPITPPEAVLGRENPLPPFYYAARRREALKKLQGLQRSRTGAQTQAAAQDAALWQEVARRTECFDGEDCTNDGS